MFDYGDYKEAAGVFHPDTSNWPKFGRGVAMSALKALLGGWIACGFLFYSFADPLSNIHDASDLHPLLDLNLAAMLCGPGEDVKEAEDGAKPNKASAAEAAPAPSGQGESGQGESGQGESDKKGGTSGGGISTVYGCPTPTQRSKVPRAKGKPPCPWPYNLYPGAEAMKTMAGDWGNKWKEIIKFTKEDPEGFFAKVQYMLNVVFWIPFATIWYWIPFFGANGGGQGFEAWFSHSTAITWLTYRYILATIFCFGPPDAAPKPFFKIQFMAFPYAFLCIIMAVTILPMVLPVLAGVCQVFGAYLSPQRPDTSPDARPTVPGAVGFIYTAMMALPNILYFAILPFVASLYFAYLVMLGPLFKDKPLFMATVRCNQNFITLLFATMVLGEGFLTLEMETFYFLSGAYMLLLLRYMYRNKDWFYGIIHM